MFEKIMDMWTALGREKRMVAIGVAFSFLLLIVLVLVFFAGSADHDGNETEHHGSENRYTEGSELHSGGDDTEESSDKEDIPTEQESQIETENRTESESETESEDQTQSESEPESESQKEEDKKEDPQEEMNGNMTDQDGSHVDIGDVVDKLPTDETQELTLGIDVARYQGTIDWKKVAASGIDFVMVRVGYRTLKTGEIVADPTAKYNMQQAAKYGIKVGVYFFSTAISKQEAIEEADWVADQIAKYQIRYPVVYNCERYEDPENRQYSLTKTQRTDYAIAFLEKIAERGYSPMFYASRGELENDAKWETSRLEKKYKIWVAQYPEKPYPETEKSSYAGTHDMWQYTNKGNVPGISEPVDMNVAYFGVHNNTGTQEPEIPDEEKPDPGVLMNFRDVNEVVTAKEKTNLRDIPSQGSDSKVVHTLFNGETAVRTGISDSGWSRVEYKGNIYYAVSSLLTTDLDYKPPTTEQPSESESENGIKTKFTKVDELVTAKDAVNLRTLPSVEHEDSEVVVQIKHGDVVRRTGINHELGWSRIEYNGQELYCISSYLMLAEDEED